MSRPPKPARTIVLSSRAFGPRMHVRVIVYDELTDMRAAAEAYNGNDLSDALGVTQARTNPDGRAGSVIVRLWRGAVGTQVITHELHHATTALWGAVVKDGMSVRRHELNHYNEEAAHLYSDLARKLVDRLHALGYYDDTLEVAA